MKKIKFFLRKDEYIILDFQGKEDGMLSMDFGEDFSGKLIIGTHAYKISGGHTVIDTVNLDDGPIELFVIKDKKSYPAEGFEKFGKIIKLSSLSDLYIRELLEKQIDVERKLKELAELCRSISDKITHTTIF